MFANQQNPHVQIQDYSAMANRESFVAQALGVPRVGAKCELEMDADLKLVMEFMQSNMPASKLVGVAQALAALAPVIWARYEREDVHALVLSVPPLTRGSTLQQAAT